MARRRAISIYVIMALLIMAVLRAENHVQATKEQTKIVRWDKIDPKSGSPPSARHYHSCALVGGKMYVFGGKTSITTLSDEFYSFDLGTKSWQKQVFNPQSPLKKVPRLFGHTMTQVASDLYIFGGRDGLMSYSSKLYKVNVETAVMTELETKGTGPSARQAHSATVINNGTTLFVYGGSDSSRQLSDAYKLNLETLEWTQVKSSPSPSEGHSPVLSNDGSLIYFFGGYNGTDYTEVVRGYDIVKNDWVTNLGKGPARAFQTAAKVGHFVYFFGGLTKANRSGGMAAYHPTAFSMIDHSLVDKDAATAPSGRQGHCDVVAGNEVFVWGGNAGAFTNFNDMWMLNTTRQLSDTVPQTDIDRTIRDAEYLLSHMSSVITTGDSLTQGALHLLQQDKEYEHLSSQIPEILQKCKQLTELDRSNKDDTSLTSATLAVQKLMDEIENLTQRYQATGDIVKKANDKLMADSQLLKDAEGKYETAKQARRDATFKFENDRRTLDRIREELGALKRRQELLKKENQKFEADHKTFEDKLAEHNQEKSNEKLEQLKEELGNKKKEQTETKEAIAKAEEALKGLKKEQDTQHNILITIELLDTRIKAVEQDLERTKETVHSYEESKSTLSQQVPSDDERYVEVRKVIEELIKDQSIKEAEANNQEKLRKLKAELDKIGKQPKELREYVAQLDVQIAEKQREQKKLKDVEESIKQDVRKKEDQIGELVKQQANFEKERESLTQELKRVKDNIAKTKDELSKMNEKINEQKDAETLAMANASLLQEAVKKCQNEEDDILMKIRSLKGDVFDMLTTVKANIQRSNEIQKELEQARRGLERAKSNLDTKTSRASKEREVLKTVVKSLTKANDECSQENARLQSRIHELEQQLATQQQPASIVSKNDSTVATEATPTETTATDAVPTDANVIPPVQDVATD